MKSVDNASYKQQYHFKDDFRDTAREHPSINAPDKINSTIKENPYRSNVEIEGGEVVLQPDLSALFKANGKKHSGGGMDVYLRPDSFVFSDFKDLNITENEKELFELKMGGSAKGASTPAQTVKQNINAKHYNSLINNITDPYKDDLARKSSAMMLEKYIQTLGNIAYLQEKKKEFPDGLPAFSFGTAPVYDSSLKDDIMANKQYMKTGGSVGNPYMQTGGNFYEKLLKEQEARYNKMLQDKAKKDEVDKTTANQVASMYLPQISKKPSDIITPPPQNAQTAKVNAAVNAPTQSGWGPWKGDKMPIFQDRYGVTNAADKFDRIKNWDDVTKQLGYTGPKYNLSFQKWLYNSSPENKAIVDKWHNQYKQGPNAGMFDGKIGIRWASALNEILDGKKPAATTPIEEQVGLHEDPITNAPAQPAGPEVPNLDVTAQGVKRADWQFTPWQKISQGYNAAQMANIRRYMPYRSRYNATYVDPALLNPEQAVGDVKGSLNQQINSLGTLNPIMRNAQAAASYGQAISQIPGIRSQYDNQNAQIMNQFRQYNNQVRNNESMVNMANDQTYYQQAIEGRKNFDNMRQFTANNAMNNVLRDVETNQKLAYNMLTLNNPAYGYDWKSGDFYRNKKDIMDVQSSSNQQENLLQLAEDLKQKGYSEKLIGDILKTKAFQTWQPTQVPKFKKGGKTKNPYK